MDVTTQKLRQHFLSLLNDGVCRLMAKEIHQIRLSAAQTMVDNYHQSGAKSWEQWVNNSPLNNIRQNHPETFDKLQNYQSQFTENIYAPLSSYLSSPHNIFKGSANNLIKQVLAVYKQIKLRGIAPNGLVQIDLRSQHDIFPRAFTPSNDEELVYESDDADEADIHYESEHDSASLTSKTEIVDVIFEEKIDKIMRQWTMSSDSHCYKRYEVLLHGTDIKPFEAASNNSIPDCAFENAPLCMIFNSTASVGQILNKFGTATTGLITVSFHVYHESINVYLYVSDDKGQLFGSRIFADDLSSMVPLLFEDRKVDENIMNELNNYSAFKPGFIYSQYHLLVMQHAVNQNESNVEQKISIDDGYTFNEHKSIEAEEDDVTDINLNELNELNSNIEENAELLNDALDIDKNEDDNIIASMTTPFNALHLKQNVGNTQHEEPPWSEDENTSDQDQKDNNNDVRISATNRSKTGLINHSQCEYQGQQQYVHNIGDDADMIQSSLSLPSWNEANNDYSEPDDDDEDDIEDDAVDEESILNMTGSALSPPPWIEYVNKSHCDIDLYHDAYDEKQYVLPDNGYKEEDIQTVNKLKAIIATLRMEIQWLRVDNNELRANNNRLQRLIEIHDMANENQLDDDNKYDNDEDDENIINVASQQNAEHISLIDDINENKDENEAEVSAATIHRNQIKVWQFCLFLLIINMWFINITDLSVATAFILNIHFGTKYEHYNKYESSLCCQAINEWKSSPNIHDYNMVSICKISSISGGINKYFVHTSKQDMGKIVDDVVKKYDALDFEMIFIKATRNIYIDKQFTRSWMEYNRPSCNDEAMMYHRLDYTTAIQMIQKCAKQYVNKENRKFIVAVINYELRDNINNILYGIVLCDDEKIEKKNDKYAYKQQIHDKYGINKHDLPQKSSKNSEFINKLLLKRQIVGDDLNKINWSNLELFKSQSRNNDSINKSVTMTQKVMKGYCFIALDGLNHSNKNTNSDNMLTPIVVMDKHHNCYGIEWLLIFHIIHGNCDVGIAFKFDEKMNMFTTTSIYLDKGEIESKHKLICLKFDYCKHVRPFSLRRFKFKFDRNSIIDDDADINMQTTNQMCLTDINGLKQGQHIINQQQQNMAVYQCGGWIQGWDECTE